MAIPRVSIVMNVRNGAAYLRESLDSVLAQTYSDWELIVWDDCSTDDSAAIVAEYSDPRIRYFLSPEDTPLGQARNLAIRQVRGEWVAFCDQDDLWVPEKLQRQMAIADEDRSGSVAMIYGRTVEFFEDGRERDFDAVHEFRSLPEGNLLDEFFRDSCFVMISSVMISRAALRRIGEIPSETQLICDFYLFVAVSSHYRIRAVQDVVCRYRRHSASLSRIRRVQLHYEALWLVEQWAGRLDSAIVSKALRRHHTQIALAEISRLPTLRRGVVRLLLQGSVGYVLSRPFARLARSTRQHIGRPQWKLSQRHTTPAGYLPS